MSLFVDFVGLNTLIQDVITSSANYVGYPLTADVFSYYNPHFSLTNNGDYLAALNAHRNGPYGHPIFKQIRTSQNPLTRYQVANNIFSFVETPSREVLRTYGLDSTEATGSITIETNVTQFDTITIGDGVTASKTYTFKTFALLPTEIEIGATAAVTLANVKAKIEADFNITMTFGGSLFTRILTNKNRGKIGNFVLESSFASGNNSIVGFSGGQDTRINQVEYINSRYGDIQRFDEVPISSKYFPLQFLFGVGIDNERIQNKEDLSIDNIERILLKSSYANEMGYFVNDGINKYYNLSQVTEEDYEKIKEFYLNGGLDADDSPITTFEFMKYKETIFPREVNTYKAHVRQRTNYQNSYWRDQRADRDVLLSFGRFGYLTLDSIWPLDASSDWETKNAVYYGYDTSIFAEIRPGVLQNYYSLVADNLNTSTLDSDLKVAPYYSRLHTLRYHVASDSQYFSGLNAVDTSTVVGPTGIPIPETGSYSGVADAGERFQGTALWQAGEQAGKNPFYSSYDYFIEELRGKGKDFSIVPEFRISDHVETLLESGSQTKILDFFEVTGGLSSANQSSEATFYETYSTSDFLKHFAKIKKDHQDFAEPSTIKLTCKGLKKFLAYDSFYPALRTVDLSQRFYDSYRSNVYISRLGSTVNPVVTASFEMQSLMNPLYAPGIMFNSIKSGVACDYPLILDDLEVYHATASSGANTEDEYLINNSRFDYRVPFEAIVEPEKYLANTELICNEPHPSGNIYGSSFWDGTGDVLYKKMSSNFCAEVGNFFLKNSSFTSISSLEQSNPNFGQAVSGTTYYMRVKMYRSMDRARLTYSGSNGFYMPPQDYLSGNVVPRETITMYSRPSAFGPPCAGVTASAGFLLGENGHIDSLKGYNFPFTPPYYHGQAWADISFTADETKKYTLSEIIAKSETTYLRTDIDSFEDIWGFKTDLGPQKSTGLAGTDDQIAINFNAMQLNSSVNLFSRGQIDSINLENDTSEQPVNITTDVTEDASARWIIQTKFETPILNFKDADLTVSSSNLSTSQTPRGMWHQYGRLPTNDEGIFLSVEDIPVTWYTNKLGQSGQDAKENKSLVDLCGFSSTPAKLGQVASGRVIREAVVAVPFIEIGGEKKFFELDSDNVLNARQYLRVEDLNKKGGAVPPGSADLDTLSKRTSPSVIDMVRKAKRYVFPPSMDFLNYPEVKPFSMYVFEFTHVLSQQDLTDIWQNLPPSIGTSFEEAEASVSHPLLANELMGYGFGNDTTPKGGELPNKVRWMVFKVKQRANTNYFDKVVGVKGSPLAGQTTSRSQSLKVDQDLVSYNWPYDFFSLVELVKIDAEVTFSDLESQDGTTKNVSKGNKKKEKSSRTTQQNPTVESTRNNRGRRGR